MRGDPAASICICFRICICASSAAERVISCTSPAWPTVSHRLAPYRWAAGLAQSLYSSARADLERSQRAGGERENVPTWAPSKSPGPRTSLSGALPDLGGHWVLALSTGVLSTEYWAGANLESVRRVACGGKRQALSSQGRTGHGLSLSLLLSFPFSPPMHGERLRSKSLND